MKITLDHTEIDQALINFVRKQGLNVEAGDIEIKVQDGQISASLATSFLTAVVPTVTDVKQDMSSTTPTEVPQSEPTANEIIEEPDREELKSKLDKLGIEYAPKARTATLQTLLDEAPESAKQMSQEVSVAPKQEPEETTGDLFGQNAAATASSEESPPFDTTTPNKPVANPFGNEEPDDDKPLFGA